MSNILGHVDGMSSGLFVCGWALDLETANPCYVRVSKPDGSTVAGGRAQHDRPDLLAIDGKRCDFAFRIPLSLPTDTDRLHLFVGDTELGGSPLRIGSGTFDGHVTALNGLITGVVVERCVGGRPPLVRLQDQFGRIVADVLALPSRTAVNTGEYPTVYRFELPMREELFAFDELTLIASIDGRILGKAAVAARLHGYLDHFSPERIAGWLNSPDAVDHRFNVEVYYDERLVGSGRCDIPRDDLKTEYLAQWDSGFDIPLRLTGSRQFSGAKLSIRLPGSATELLGGPFVISQPSALIGAGRKVVAKLREYQDFSELEIASFEHAFKDFFSKQRLTPVSDIQRLPIKERVETTYRQLNIIIPIYRNVEVTKACIESVLTTREELRDIIVLINDCSPDREMMAMLSAFEGSPNLFILHNAENVGFVKTANRGLKFCRVGDCVLLNSDTIVYGGIWGEFSNIIREHRGVGTITALSNNATIFSYPHPKTARSEPLEDISWADIAAEALVQNSGRIIDVPTGHGFCMLIRREVLDEIRYLDDRFGRGYGEENDLCQRAADLGWRSVAACGVFVQHRESVSFAEEKVALLRKNLTTLSSLYPEYTPAIMEYERNDPLRAARWALDALRYRRIRESGKRFAVVAHNWLGGGTDVAIADLEQAFGYSGRLRITLKFCEGGRRELLCKEFDIFSVFFETENNRLFDLLDEAGIDLFLVHQLVGSDEAFINDLTNWLRVRSHVSTVYHVHDFYSICQRVTMFDARGKFCRAADSAVCARCLSIVGAHEANRVNLPPTEHRAMFGQFLSNCSVVIAPSSDAAKWIERVFPAIEVFVRPHPAEHLPVRPLRRGDPDQIIVLGAISHEKGSRRLLEVARYARLNRPELRFHIVGYTDIDKELKQVGNISITGRYNRDKLPAMIDKIDGVIALFLYEWPETFSYTLSEALALGLWPMVPDLGAPAERVRSCGIGTVLTNMQEEAIVETLYSFRSNLELQYDLPLAPRSF